MAIAAVIIRIDKFLSWYTTLHFLWSAVVETRTLSLRMDVHKSHGKTTSSYIFGLKSMLQ